MKYPIEEEYWTRGYGYRTLDVDPSNYLDCEDEDEVLDAVNDDLHCIDMEINPQDYDLIEHTFPEEDKFLQEWRTLKEMRKKL